MALRLAAKTLVMLAGLCLLTALTLCSLAGFLLTWPYRHNARNAQLRATMQFALAAAALVQALQKRDPPTE